MQFSDDSMMADREKNLLSALPTTDQGKRLLDLMRRELLRLDKQNRIIGGENKESAAGWIAGFLEQVDSDKATTDMPPDQADQPQANDLSLV